MMRKMIILALLVVGLSGCANPPYGNFAKASQEADRQMANDTVKQLVALYLPAHTRFNLKQPTKDAYGTALVKSLRSKGYGLVEFVPSDKKTEAVAKVPLSTTPAVDLLYVVDAPDSNNLYRVIVTVGQQTISRAYVLKNGTLYPAGYWARKE